MSFLLHAPKKIVVKPKHGEPTTVSILLISVAVFLAIILVTHMSYMWMESSLNLSSGCKDKIIGFSQRGMYTSPEQFKLALSYCEG
jgi:hypothetical protein